MRGVAILAVVAIHSFQATLGSEAVPTYSESSRTFVGFSLLRFGVELFYLLSGWLMFSIYRANQRETGVQYLAKRAGRIWPLWIAFTLLSFFTLATQWTLSPVDGRFQSDSLLQWVLAIGLAVFFLGWLSPELWNIPAGGWSIQVEIGHYSIFWFLRKVTDVTLLVSVLIGYSTFFLADYLRQSAPWDALQSFSESWIRLGLFGTWPFFVAGGLAVIWRRSEKENHKLRPMNSSAFIRVVLLVTIAITAWWVPIPFGMTYEAVVTCVVLLSVSWVAIKWLPSLKGGAFLGRYSYFVYFAHFWILELAIAGLYKILSPEGVPSALQFWLLFLVVFSVTLAISLALAVPSWRFFESKWITLSRRVGTKG